MEKLGVVNNNDMLHNVVISANLRIFKCFIVLLLIGINFDFGVIF